MKEDFVRFSSGELNYLISALQYLSSHTQAYFEEHTKVDSAKLYAKLFDAWETLETND